MENIRHYFFRAQIILILTIALILGVAGTLINIYYETVKCDQNLQNAAEAIAHSPILTEEDNSETSQILLKYLDSLKETLKDIDVISVVDTDNCRLYHSNHDLIGTVYDGTLPQFSENMQSFYTENAKGPSGTQRRAYAAIYNENGEYIGFVMAIMLMKNIYLETLQIFLVFSLVTVLTIAIEIVISARLFQRIKTSLMGYEPDTFSAMYKMRDDILESLDEGIVAVDSQGKIQFTNKAAVDMLPNMDEGSRYLRNTLKTGKKELNRNLNKAEVLMDSIPIREGDSVICAIGILHNRAEYTRLMEDLTGTRYLVDSMRANNHDFTNKLHVILGLLQMEMYEEAMEYIQKITIVQRETLSKIMNAVSEPAVAALLIGKTAQASEFNVKFVLRENCHFDPTDYRIPSETLVTIIGNLLENALEAMNVANEFEAQNELLFGIYSHPGAVLITVDDTGSGMLQEEKAHMFENGFSTKGKGRGTGLYQVKNMVESLGGSITVESQENVGTSFSVSFMQNEVNEQKYKLEKK